MKHIKYFEDYHYEDEEGFDGWMTTGSIGRRIYTDYAIFDDSAFNIVEMKIKTNTWTDYMSLDDAEEFLNSVCEKED